MFRLVTRVDGARAALTPSPRRWRRSRSLAARRGPRDPGGVLGPRASMLPKMPARAAGRSVASRDTSPAVRAWLLRGDQEVLRACILSKVPTVPGTYGTGTVVPVPRSSARPRSACKGARTRRTRFVGAPQRVREEPSPPRSRLVCLGSPTNTDDIGWQPSPRPRREKSSSPSTNVLRH